VLWFVAGMKKYGQIVEAGEEDSYFRDDQLLGLAERLHACLPPRSGGALGLLERAPTADVVFLAHVGFESVRTFGDILRGTLIGQPIRVGLWRVPAGQIPRDPDARRRWLYEQWLEVDRWIAAAS
jgi:hypothetical protein